MSETEATGAEGDNREKEFAERYLRDHVAEVARDGRPAIEVDYSDVLRYDPDLADDLINEPMETINDITVGVGELSLPVEIPSGVKVHVVGEPNKKRIRELRAGEDEDGDLGKLVTVDGVISKATEVRAEVTKGVFECKRCTSYNIQKQHLEDEISGPGECEGCGRNGPFELIEEKSEFRSCQTLRVQDLPENLSAGSTPASVTMRVYGHLCDEVAAGDRARIVGIVRTETSDKRRRGFWIQPESIKSLETDMDNVELSDEDRERIHEAAERDDIEDALVNSFAPSIHGYETEKRAMLYQLFGSPIKELADDTEKRGDVHVLLIGDPGTGKSQLIEYAHEVAPRSVHTSAKNATGVGLTATAEQDDFGDSTEWTIKPGALPMADKGLIAVDELDKTDKDSRGALHEALEQQQVSYSKAGKTGQFRARCSLLAAANPSEGRFDDYESVVSQVDLEPPLISRFDLIFTVTDEADEESDRELAEHILDSIREAQTGEYDVTEPEYDTEFLRKYISYARRKIEPSLTDEAYRELAEWYVDFRNSTDSETDTIPTTARQLEAAERLAEASARTRLSDEVTKKDVDNAIGLLMSSLLRVGRDPETGNFDADILESGISQSQRERKRTFEQIVRELTENGSAPIDDIIEACEDEGIMSERDVYDEIDDRKRRGDMMEPAQDEVRLIE